MATKENRLPYCLNCKYPLRKSDKYCPNCGQENRSSKISLQLFFKDFFQDYIALDSKFLKTVWPLLFYPGKLTKEFNSGHRIRFVPPLRLYIFVSFIYFFILALNTDMDKGIVKINDNSPAEEMYEGFTESDSSLVTNDTSLAEEDSVISPEAEAGVSNTVEEKLEVVFDMMKNKPEEAKSKAIKGISITTFFLLPVFALLLQLLYIRRSYYYIEHLVFSIHFHSFIFILFTISLLGDLYFSEWFSVLATLTSLVYFFVALKNVYRQSFLKTFLKFFIIINSYFLIVLLFILAGLFLYFLATV